MLVSTISEVKQVEPTRDGNLEGAVILPLTSVGGVVIVVRSGIKGAPKRALGEGDSLIKITSGESAAITIQGRVTLEEEVEGNTALHTVAERGTSCGIISVKGFVGQVIATSDSSLKTGENKIVTLRDANCSYGNRICKAPPVLPIGNRKFTVILVINQKNIRRRPTWGQ